MVSHTFIVSDGLADFANVLRSSRLQGQALFTLPCLLRDIRENIVLL